MQKQEIYRKDYKKPDFTITNVHMEITVIEDLVKINTKLNIKKESNVENVPCILNGEYFKTNSVNVSANYEIKDNQLIIKNPNSEFILETEVEIDPKKNTELEGIYESAGIITSHCEPEGFRRITWFIDRPDVMATYKVKITANKQKYPVLLSNGNLISKKDIDENTQEVIWEDPYKKPSYLFAFVAGDLDKLEDKFITKSGLEVELGIYVEKGKKNLASYAISCVKKAMKWDEEYYGREYDLSVFNIVAVSSFNMGAMENKGLNIFNDALILADYHLANDSDYKRIDRVIAHEYFHNWTGDRITCRDWFQLTLKEGLTVFREEEYAYTTISTAERAADVSILRKTQFTEDSSPLSHPIRPDSYVEMNNFYTATVYDKGAEVIRTLRTYLGDSIFSNGLNLYFKKYDGNAITCDDFISCFEEISGKDLTDFKKWYSQSGTPNVFIEEKYVEESAKLILKLKQKTETTVNQPNKEALVIPLKIAVIGKDSKKIEDEKTVLLNKESMEVEFNAPKNYVLSANRGFSAPIIVHKNETLEDLSLIAKYETDGFAKYDAIQEFIKRQILELANNNNYMLNHNLIKDTYENILKFDDKFLVAQAITPVSIDILAGLFKENIPVEKIYDAYYKYANMVSDILDATFKNTYDSLHEHVGVLSAKAMGDRAIKNVVLWYMLQNPNKDYTSIAISQYENSKMMTMREGALKALEKREPEQLKILKLMENEYKEYPLVMDKWLRASALTPTFSAINNVKELKNSKYYSKTNPNRVRALVGAFSKNFYAFNHISGSGYKLVADTIIEIDSINSGIAALLAKSFSDVKKHTKERQDIIYSLLKNILDTKPSNNTREIIEKIIA